MFLPHSFVSTYFSVPSFWNKSEGEKQILCINTYIRNLERCYGWTYLQSSNGDTDIENRLVDPADVGGGWRGWEYGERNMETHIPMCKIDSQWKFAIWLKELKPGLSNNLDGWGGEWGGKHAQGGGNIGKPMAHSCWCLVEPTQYYKVIILQLK